MLHQLWLYGGTSKGNDYKLQQSDTETRLMISGLWQSVQDYGGTSVLSVSFRKIGGVTGLDMQNTRTARSPYYSRL